MLLPEPVGATERTSRPASMAATTSAWPGLKASSPKTSFSVRSALSITSSECDGIRTSSGRVMDLLESIHRRRDPLHSRFELKGEIQRVVTRLVQVAAVKPQPILLGWFPHVAQLAFPRPRVFGRAGTQAPAPSDLRRDLR